MRTIATTRNHLSIAHSLGLGDDVPRKYQNGKLLVRKDVSRPYYYVRVTVPVIDRITGKRKPKRLDEKLGFVDALSKDEAMRIRGAVLDRINAHRTVAPSLVRFEDVAARYLELRVSELGFATQNWERTQIKNHIRPTFGPLKLEEIDRMMVEQWLQSKSHLGWWTRNGLKRILARMFNAATEWGWLESVNPVHGIRLGRKKVVYERRLLTVQEFRSLIGALPDRSRFIVLVIFGLGLAISETLGLRWKDIDFEEKTISIRRRWYRGNLSEETKTETRTATLRLGESLLQEFAQRYPGPHKREDFLFIGEDGHNPPDDRDLGRFELRPVLKALGLYTPGNLWHSFRRQNITWRQQLGGATPMEAMKAARHASLDMTLLYSLTDAERETAQQQRMFDELMKTEGLKQ